MKECPQTKDQSVWEHGQSVWRHTKKIISGEFDLPEWFKKNHATIVNGMCGLEVVKNYNIYHDCGKPFCIEYDEEGRKHFPEHELVSARTWRALGSFPGMSGRDFGSIARLISLDMSLHTLTVENVKQLDVSKEEAYTLIVTAFAEIFSNAELFGGRSSTNFKIKYKKVEKNARNLFLKFQEELPHKYSYVIVRNDLSNAQKAVQGGHALAEHYRLNQDDHSSLVFIVVKNEQKLIKAAQLLLDNDIKPTFFREPDQDDTLTAICTPPLEGQERLILSKYQLLN